MSYDTVSLNLGQAYFTNWRQLTPADNAVLSAIRELGEPFQRDIAELCGMCERQVRRSIAKLKKLNIIEVISYGRANVYRLFFGPDEDEHRTAVSIQLKDKQQTTDNNKTDNKKSSKRQITDADYDNAKAFGIQVEAPITCVKGKPTLDAKLRGKAGQRISDNLQAWRDALDAGTLDLYYKGAPMTVNLIATKIVEMQAPPILTDPTPEPSNNITPIPQDYHEPITDPEPDYQVCQDDGRELAESGQDQDFASIVGTLGTKAMDTHLTGSYIDRVDGDIMHVSVKTEYNAQWLNGRLKNVVMQKIRDDYPDISDVRFNYGY